MKLYTIINIFCLFYFLFNLHKSLKILVHLYQDVLCSITPVHILRGHFNIGLLWTFNTGLLWTFNTGLLWTFNTGLLGPI